MVYMQQELEKTALLATAARMCTAARTAPKARGIDNLQTLVLTDADKDALADKMDEIAQREFGEQPNIFRRDAHNLRAAQAVVLLGVAPFYAGAPCCGMCGFAHCAACQAAGARCVFDGVHLGIAIAAAAEAAARDHVDNRVMFSVGRAAAEMPYEASGKVIWHGIPLHVSSKNIFFDRA